MPVLESVGPGALEGVKRSMDNFNRGAHVSDESMFKALALLSAVGALCMVVLWFTLQGKKK